MNKESDLRNLCKSKSLLKLGQVTALVSYCFRKAMLSYCLYENKTTRTNVLMDFIRRIEANASGVREMAKATILTYKSSPYLKLPMGLLIRNCLMDSLQGLYFSTLEDDSFNIALHSFNQDYVKSLPSRFEAYQDRVGSFEDDVLLQQIFGLQIEDVFPEYIDWSCFDKKTRSFKIANKKGQYTLASMYCNLKKNEDYSFLASKLYAYYKKYSQYEHYSQMGNGDSLVPFDEDAPLMAKAYDYIVTATTMIAENIEGPAEVLGIMGRAKDEVEETLNSNS